MRADDDIGEPVVKVMIADPSPFQRRLTADAMRGAGRIQVHYADDVAACIQALHILHPTIVVTEWDLPGGTGLELTRRIRAGEAGEGFRQLPIIMVAAKKTEGDVQRARDLGVDEFVLRPFSTSAMAKRFVEVTSRRREFVASPLYAGPCRRRRVADERYQGPRRRLLDAQDAQADAPEIQIRKGMARMYCERIGVLLQALAPGDVAGVRDLGLTCGQLSALAGDMKDTLLISASTSLFNYVKGVGADAALSAGVVKAHLDAIVQLAELPNYKAEIRQTVTHELSVLVAKKLRQAGQAA